MWNIQFCLSVITTVIEIGDPQIYYIATIINFLRTATSYGRFGYITSQECYVQQ